MELAHRVPCGTLCLLTALARHNLTDAIPDRIDIAIPRGMRIPALRSVIKVHVFAKKTFVQDFLVEDRPISPVEDHLTGSLAEPKATSLTLPFSCWQVCEL